MLLPSYLIPAFAAFVSFLAIFIPYLVHVLSGRARTWLPLISEINLTKNTTERGTMFVLLLIAYGLDILSGFLMYFSNTLQFHTHRNNSLFKTVCFVLFSGSTTCFLVRFFFNKCENVILHGILTVSSGALFLSWSFLSLHTVCSKLLLIRYAIATSTMFSLIYAVYAVLKATYLYPVAFEQCDFAIGDYVFIEVALNEYFLYISFCLYLGLFALDMKSYEERLSKED
ncbi:hypothetical protein GEMRC1_007240 [Eukaryota sp. GEM-RC1]